MFWNWSQKFLEPMWRNLACKCFRISALGEVPSIAPSWRKSHKELSSDHPYFNRFVNCSWIRSTNGCSPSAGSGTDCRTSWRAATTNLGSLKQPISWKWIFRGARIQFLDLCRRPRFPFCGVNVAVVNAMKFSHRELLWGQKRFSWKILSPLFTRFKLF